MPFNILFGEYALSNKPDLSDKIASLGDKITV